MAGAPGGGRRFRPDPWVRPSRSPREHRDACEAPIPTPRPPLRPLFDRRLLIVTGKGGTGKTTVAAALACRAAGSGRRVLLVETGRDDQAPAIIGPAPAEARPECLRIEPFEALSEYLGLQIGVPAVARRVLANEGFQQLLEAAPGWRELITLGKIWHLEQSEAPRVRGADARPTWDLIIVDAPATGHGLTFLDVPRIAQAAVRAGPLRRHAGWVEELVRDEARTLLLPVALGEELPVRETLELVARLRESQGVPIDRIVLNAFVDAPCPAVPDLGERLRALAHPGAAALAHAVVAEDARHAMHRAAEATLADGSALPVVRLPRAEGRLVGAERLASWVAPLAGESA